MPAQKPGSCSLFEHNPRKNLPVQAKCAPCGSGVPPRKECFKCFSCHSSACQAACAREAARSCLCGHTGGAAHDSQSSAHDAPLGSQSSAEEVQGHEEEHPARREAGAGRGGQCLTHDVQAAVLQGEVLVRRLRQRMTVQHVGLAKGSASIWSRKLVL